MPRPVRYRCETLVTPLHPTRTAGMLTMQTAREAASVWGSEVRLDDGQVFSVQPVSGGLFRAGRHTYWEWRRDTARRLQLSEVRRRFPALSL